MPLERRAAAGPACPCRPSSSCRWAPRWASPPWSWWRIVPTWRLHLRFRPALRFPPGVARRAGGLALCRRHRAHRRRPGHAWSPSPWPTGTGRPARSSSSTTPRRCSARVSAVLAISVVVSAFPVLSARDGPEFDRTSAGSTRAVLLLSWLGHRRDRGDRRCPPRHVLATQPDQVPAAGAVRLSCSLPGWPGVARDREPVPGDVRHRAAQGRGRGAWPAAGCSRSWPGCRAGRSWCRRTWWWPRWRWGPPSARPRWRSRWCWSPAGSAAGPPSQGAGHAALAGLAAGAVGAAVGVAVSLAAPSGSASSWRPPWRCSRPACAVIAFGVVAYLLDRGRPEGGRGPAAAGGPGPSVIRAAGCACCRRPGRRSWRWSRSRQ